nr:immunoglobulin light chain junction region [Macaca mulatta]MOW03411.1 immunoglobulin light chain junction region [Macaca mulatta]MOW03543.1 immunoglobulin light chain junction region [Macaca mulatta]
DYYCGSYRSGNSWVF